MNNVKQCAIDIIEEKKNAIMKHIRIENDLDIVYYPRLLCS